VLVAAAIGLSRFPASLPDPKKLSEGEEVSEKQEQGTLRPFDKLLFVFRACAARQN